MATSVKHAWAWPTCRRSVQLCRAVSTAWLAALSVGPVLMSLRRLAGSGESSSLLCSAAPHTISCIFHMLHASIWHPSLALESEDQEGHEQCIALENPTCKWDTSDRSPSAARACWSSDTSGCTTPGAGSSVVASGAPSPPRKSLVSRMHRHTVANGAAHVCMRSTLSSTPARYEVSGCGSPAPPESAGCSYQALG
jgi:hypothetical protein